MKQHINIFIVRPFILLFLLFGLISNAYGEPSDYWDSVEQVTDNRDPGIFGVSVGDAPGILDVPDADDVKVFKDNHEILAEYFPILMGKVQSALEGAPGGGVIWDKINAVLGSGHLDNALKALEVIGHVADFAFAAKDIGEAFMDDDQDAFEDAVFNLSEMIVVKLGEWAGSHFGPSIGAQIGTMINPGIGTAIGWLGGKIWGDNIGGKLGEWLIGFFEPDIKNLAGRLYARLKDGGGDDGGGSGGGGDSLDIPIDPTDGAADYVRPFIYSGPGGYYGPGGAGINGGNGHPTANAVGGNSPGVAREKEIEAVGE